jgi:DNA replication licensing factor MCM5
MCLLKLATEEHAKEAIRLFQSSTVDAISVGIQSNNLSEELIKEVQLIEDQIKKRLPINSITNLENLICLLEKNNNSRYSIERAIFIMCQRNELEYKFQRKCVLRKK